MKPAPPEQARRPPCTLAFTGSLEELEVRLEAQMAGPAASLDDSGCVYYLCTMRCESPKCTAFMPP